MYDIIFLSYNEANADKHWKNLKSRFPRAQRVHGVKGIVNAHKAAAAKCVTRWFWVVDGDNIINDDFDFSFTWDQIPHKHTVAVWRAQNNVNGLIYGYGGIKLLPRRRVLEINSDVVDFTTSIGEHFIVKSEVASTTVINSTPFEAWKSGFRECAKLASAVIDRQKSNETENRLETWCTVANGDYADEVLSGAKLGKQFGQVNIGDKEVLSKLNDFNWLEEQFNNRNVNTNIVSVLRGLENLYEEKPFIKSLRQSVAEYPQGEWGDAMSRGQIESKKWLTKKIVDLFYQPTNHTPEWFDDPHKYLRKIYLCASWYGILAEFILDSPLQEYIGQIRGLDIDPHAVEIANRLMKHRADGWAFKSTQCDIMDLKFKNDEFEFVRHDGEVVKRTDKPSMVINTSCEHIENFAEWWDNIPSGIAVAVQSNNYFDHIQHVNCMDDLAEFEQSTPMTYCLYQGELNLSKYTRFMRIGIK